MKYRTYIYMIAAALIVVGCDNELTVEEPVIGPELSTESAFSGVIVDELAPLDVEGCEGEKVAETRASMTNGVFTSWKVGDMVSISDGHRLYYQYGVSELESNPSSCYFTINREHNGSAFEDKEGFLDRTYYVFYPAEAVESWDANGVLTAQIYSEQDYKENANDGLMGPYMASKATQREVNGKKDIHFSFKHCASVVEVDLSAFTSNTIGAGRPVAVSIMSNSGVSLSGRFEYDIDNKDFLVYNNDATPYATSHQSDVVTVSNIPEGATSARLYILPVQIKGGVTVTVRTADDEYYTKSTSSDIGNATDATTMDGIDDVTVCTPYYKKISFGTVTKTTKVNDYMATIPSNTYFSMISTVGAHNAAASIFASQAGDVTEPWSKTQAMMIGSISEGRQAGLVNRYGVRAYDLRAPYLTSESAGTWLGFVGHFPAKDMTKDQMKIFHGITQTAYTFNRVVTELADYLRVHKSEAITICFKKETNINETAGVLLSPTDHTTGMWNALNEIFSDQADIIHVGMTDGLTLGDVRGKLVVLNRQESDLVNGVTKKGAELCPYATNIYGWDDNRPWLNCPLGTQNADERGVCILHIEDEYKPVGSSTDGFTEYKKDKFDAALEQNLTLRSKNDYFFIYSAIAAAATSVTTMVTAISTYAASMNPKAVASIQNHHGPVGYVFGDFLGDETCGGHTLTKTILTHNTTYIYADRTRCKYSSTGAGTGGGNEEADNGPVYIKRK